VCEEGGRVDTYYPLYLYDLAANCQNFGGYYYDGGDGYVYWHDCAAAMH
jgi:hypothetical protein